MVPKSAVLPGDVLERGWTEVRFGKGGWRHCLPPQTGQGATSRVGGIYIPPGSKPYGHMAQLFSGNRGFRHEGWGQVYTSSLSRETPLEEDPGGRSERRGGGA